VDLVPVPRSARRFDRDVLAAADAWGAGRCGVAVLDRDGLVAERGARDAVLPWASITKVVAALTVHRLAGDGRVGLDESAGPPGSTVAHLLAHASGLAFDEAAVISPPARSRIYSNAGFDVLAAHVEARTGAPFAGLVRDLVTAPLGMSGAELAGPASQGMRGTLRDLEALAFELLRPTLLPAAAFARATSVAFPGLRGVLPGFGLQDPCDWSLGFELKGTKQPHWTGSRNDPGTFGHFGGSGCFVWVDPAAGLALVALTDRPFGRWAVEAWAPFSDAVLGAAGA
jgi:CubicO group peptidase (beta-lactamase class C family)